MARSTTVSGSTCWPTNTERSKRATMIPDAPTLDRVMHLFEHTLGLPVHDPDTDLLASGAVDSLVFVNMLLQLETEFGVKVSLEDIDLEHFRSPACIARYIALRQTG